MSTTLKHWAVAILLTVLGGNMSGCAGGSTKWKEEVQLGDGRIIVVEREAIYVGGGDEWASNRGGSKIDGYRIRYTMPDGLGKTVEWHSTKKDSQTYPEVPLVFDLPAGQPTVFSLIGISRACEVYSKYVYQNGSWVEEPLPEQFGQLTTNLLFASKRDLPKLLTRAEKNQRNSEPGHRQALKQIGPTRKVCG
jgi:hypothetical protein